MLAAVCRIFTWVYLVLAIGSVLLIPASDAGVLGLDSEPLAAVFAIFLGLPWSLLVGDYASDTSLAWNVLLFTLGPALNAVILIFLCRFTRGFEHDE